MSEAYKAAGVNLELGDELSGMLYEAARQTWPNRAGRFGEPTAQFDSFSTPRDISIAPLLEVTRPEGITLYMGDDGVGTKVEVAQRMGKHDTIAFDLLAMVCDDAAIKGYEPAAVTTTLDVRKLEKSMRPAMQQLALGYIAAANTARVALVNGETAELGDLVGGYEGGDGFMYNWNATVLAAGHEERLLDGSKVEEGDSLVALQEHGFRSNGLSLVRKVAAERYGREWHEARNETLGKSLGELVLSPSIIYSPVLVEAIGGYDLGNEAKAEVRAAAHITGGGIPGKLGRMLLASGLGAEIEEPYSPPEVMLELQKLAGVPDEEIYNVWNMGQGMIVATPEPEKLVAIARNHNKDAKPVGLVVDRPWIRVRSAGAKTPGNILEYPLAV